MKPCVLEDCFFLFSFFRVFVILLVSDFGCSEARKPASRAMQDPFSWAFPLGRFFGIPVKVNVLFPLVAAGLILRAAFQKDVEPGSWIDAAMLMALLFVVVLLHEFGHCFGARAVDGDAQEVMMWPLGGLAFVDVPHTPRANFIAVAAGPAVNLVIC